jgi:hypothetical protein
MPIRFIVCLSAVIVSIAASNGASAAIWDWGCQGQLGGQQVIFNRYSMVVVDTKAKLGDVHKLRLGEIKLPAGSPPSVAYNPADQNGGFEQTMEFTRDDDSKAKLVLTEKSSRRVSHRHKLICGRDEDTDIYRKVYSFQPGDEPARDITMQCIEYQLSTRGGRKGCD